MPRSKIVLNFEVYLIFMESFFFVGVGERSIYFIRKDGTLIHKQNNLTQNIKHYAFKNAGEFSICNDNDVIKTYNVKRINRCIEISLDYELTKNKLSSPISSLIYDKVKGDLILGNENGFIGILKKKWHLWKPR